MSVTRFALIAAVLCTWTLFPLPTFAETTDFDLGCPRTPQEAALRWHTDPAVWKTTPFGLSHALEGFDATTVSASFVVPKDTLIVREDEPRHPFLFPGDAFQGTVLIRVTCIAIPNTIPPSRFPPSFCPDNAADAVRLLGGDGWSDPDWQIAVNREYGREVWYESATPITFTVPRHTLVYDRVADRNVLPGYVIMSATKLTLACYF